MDKTLKIVLVEDEPISSLYLQNLISETDIKHEIVAEITSVAMALSFFTKNPDFDLIFMDIHLGDGTCFDILDTTGIEKPIIFCTTFDTYAVQAFKYNSIDYILKPAKINDVENALKKYWSFKKSDEDDYLVRMDKMMDSFTPPRYKKRFLIRNENRLKPILISNVSCFYSEEGNTYLVEKSGHSHIVDFTLERLEELIDPNDFFRINRKMMINIDEIHSAEDYFNSRLKITLQTNQSELDLVVSRNRVRHFKNWLKGVS